MVLLGVSTGLQNMALKIIFVTEDELEDADKDDNGHLLF